MLKCAVIKHVCYAASPVWATICVHPLQTRQIFSPPSRDLFTGVGEDRKRSLLMCWPCLLLPQKNKSPSSGDRRNREIHRNMCNVLYWKNDQLEHERSNVYVSHLPDIHNASNQQLPYVQSSDPDLQTHISAHLGTIGGTMRTPKNCTWKELFMIILL